MWHIHCREILENENRELILNEKYLKNILKEVTQCSTPLWQHRISFHVLSVTFSLDSKGVDAFNDAASVQWKTQHWVYALAYTNHLCNVGHSRLFVIWGAMDTFGDCPINLSLVGEIIWSHQPSRSQATSYRFLGLRTNTEWKVFKIYPKGVAQCRLPFSIT